MDARTDETTALVARAHTQYKNIGNKTKYSCIHKTEVRRHCKLTFVPSVVTVRQLLSSIKL